MFTYIMTIQVNSLDYKCLLVAEVFFKAQAQAVCRRSQTLLSRLMMLQSIIVPVVIFKILLSYIEYMISIIVKFWYRKTIFSTQFETIKYWTYINI